MIYTYQYWALFISYFLMYFLCINFLISPLICSLPLSFTRTLFHCKHFYHIINCLLLRNKTRKAVYNHTNRVHYICINSHTYITEFIKIVVFFLTTDFAYYNFSNSFLKKLDYINFPLNDYFVNRISQVFNRMLTIWALESNHGVIYSVAPCKL